jgi:hypothetical protein
MQVIRLYDPRRRLRGWTDLVRPDQLTVLLKHAGSGVPLAADATTPVPPSLAIGIVFDTLAEAEAFCRKTVECHADVRCEVLDAEGRAHPPLLVVESPTAAGVDESSRSWFLRRSTIASVVGAALLLLVWDYRTGWLHIWPTIFGVNLLVAAGRLSMWRSGVIDAEAERDRRLRTRREQEADKRG